MYTSGTASESAIGVFDLQGLLVWRNPIFAQRFGSLEVPAEVGTSYCDIWVGLAQSDPCCLNIMSSDLAKAHSEQPAATELVLLWAKSHWKAITAAGHAQGGSEAELKLSDGRTWRITASMISTNGAEQVLFVASDVSHLSQEISSREMALYILRHSLGGSHWRTGLEQIAKQLTDAYRVTRFLLIRLEGDPDAGPGGAIHRLATGYEYMCEETLQAPSFDSHITGQEAKISDNLDSLRWCDIASVGLPTSLRHWLGASMTQGAVALDDLEQLKLQDLTCPLPRQGYSCIAPLFVDERPWGALLVITPDKSRAEGLLSALDRLGLILSYVIQSMFNQDRLISLRSEADEEEGTRNKFLAQVSHEIRTPLQGLMGALDLAEAEVAAHSTNRAANQPTGQPTKQLENQISEVVALNSRLKDLIDVANRSSLDLLSVVNDVLDYSRLQSNHFTLTPTWTSPSALVDSVGELFHAAAREKGLDLGLAYQELPLGDWWLDQQRVRQILVNFVENAIKYTQLGGVLISVHVGHPEPGDPGDATPIEFSVSDTGPGMSEEAQRTVFDAFTRSETETARRAPGSGLGLEICTRLGAAMGGHVSVESTRGQGSTFTLRLAGRMRPSLTPSPLREALAGRQCFVIAPRGERRRGLVRTLKSLSAVVNFYESLSAELLEDLENSGVLIAADYIFIAPRDAAFIHRSLYQVPTQTSKQRESKTQRPRGHTQQNWQTVQAKICVLPSGPEDETQGLDLPPGSVLCRPPLSWRNLEECICGSQVSLQMAASGPLFEAPIQVLLAEDSETNQMTISAMLRMLGIEAMIVENGKRALDVFKKHHFDLVLMDLQMPIMDGLEACAACKRVEGKSNIPIIALTGSVLDEVRQACRIAGMDGFLTKPTRISDFREILLYWLDPERGSAEEKVIEQSIPLLGRQDKSGLIDMAALQQRHFELGDEGLKKVVTVFVHETTDRVQAIRTALIQQDLNSLSAHAHTLKSATKSFGLMRIPDLAADIEAACKRGDAKEVQKLAEEFVCTVPSAMRQLSITVMELTETNLES